MTTLEIAMKRSNVKMHVAEVHNGSAVTRCIHACIEYMAGIARCNAKRRACENIWVSSCPSGQSMCSTKARSSKLLQAPQEAARIKSGVSQISFLSNRLKKSQPLSTYRSQRWFSPFFLLFFIYIYCFTAPYVSRKTIHFLRNPHVQFQHNFQLKFQSFNQPLLLLSTSPL